MPLDPHEAWLAELKEGVPQSDAADSLRKRIGGWQNAPWSLDVSIRQLEEEAAFWDLPLDGPANGDPPDPYGGSDA